MREPVWASGLAEVKRKKENLKRETRWAIGLAVVDLAALSWVAALGWMVGASRMVAGMKRPPLEVACRENVYVLVG